MLNYKELNVDIKTLSRKNPNLKIEIKLELQLKSKPKAECKPDLTLKITYLSFNGVCELPLYAEPQANPNPSI